MIFPNILKLAPREELDNEILRFAQDGFADLPCCVRPKDGNPDPVLTSTQEAAVGEFRSCLSRKTEARPRSSAR